MSRFDWKEAIVMSANAVEGCLLAADEVGPKFDFNLRQEAQRKASYAAWLARSYNRKGIKRGKGLQGVS